jgi:Phytanoyl-CoA dioxygenase (PhyH)
MRNSFENPLPGVPPIESPFFDRIFAEENVSAETLAVARDLRRDGYAVIDFPDPEIEARAARIIAALHDRYDWDGWQSGGSSARTQDAWQTNDDVRQIAANPRMLALLSELYGRRAMPFQTLNFPVGTQQHVHTDSIHFSCCPERFMCGVWLALEDVDLENGPLLYYPGSHSLPIYVNEHIAKPVGVNDHYHHYERLWDQLVDSYGLEPRRFCARKGQALIWTANLLHGGDRVADRRRTRWSQVTHYFFEGCCYYTPLSSDPFCGRISFRNLVDIATSEPMPNVLSGQPLAQQFIDGATSGRVVGVARPQVTIPADFDPAGYLRLNPDVAAAGYAARQHYVDFGHRENRRWR